MLKDFFKRRVFSRSRLQDIIFLIGIFIFSAVLIVGLFPKDDVEDNVSRIYFLYLIMTVPVIAAVYFIIVSFRRELYAGASDIGSSIRFKIALAFVFVAIIPSLPIILLSNKIITQTISELFTEKNTRSMEESLSMAHEWVLRDYNELKVELNGISSARGGSGYEFTAEHSDIYSSRGYMILRYRVQKIAEEGNVLHPADNGTAPHPLFAAGIEKLLHTVPLKREPKLYSISVQNIPLLVGSVITGNTVTVLYKKIPKKVSRRIALFEETLRRFKQQEFLKTYFETGLGIFLLLLSIIIIVLSIALSYFLSQGITRPVFELMDAAKQIAAGNFAIHLERSSQDEITLLFNSFNRMAEQLEESREVMFQTQKLQAWREMARKLVHEIKNPLTPIRLSAERIQRRYKEGHPDIETIIQTGTETIIDEVHVLKQIVSEFSRFARLPEMKPELLSINQKITNCVNFFMGNEKIIFHLNLDDSIPDILIDKILMRQALTNLLHNAIDSILEKGNIFVKSELTSYEGERIVRITIKDDGTGIREEDLPFIFEPTFSTKDSGTGLGLTIVEKIVLEHKGRIFCHSRYGAGTEFIIELPAIESEEAHGENPDR